MQRRTLLKLGIAAGMTLTLVGGGVSLIRRPAWRDDGLTAVGREVLGAIACAVLAGSLPVAAEPQRVALAAHLGRLERTLLAMPPATQREFGNLLTLLALPLGRWMLAGVGTDWASAGTVQIQSALQSMRSSRIAVRRQAYQALRDLTHAAYFADSTTWVLLGYPGPTKIE
jgi:hypothetical protein